MNNPELLSVTEETLHNSLAIPTLRVLILI